MYISLANSCTRGFKRWSNAHLPDNDDDNSGGATPIAVAVSDPAAQAGTLASESMTSAISASWVAKSGARRQATMTALFATE